MLTNIDIEKINNENLLNTMNESIETSILNKFSSISYQFVDNLIINDNLEFKENIK